jgi:hypothetical protein
MAWTADRKQAVAFYVFFLNPLHGVLKKWSSVMPHGWEVLPYLIDFLITAVAFYFIYRYSSNYRKFTLWLIPVLLSALALITYVRW